MPSHKGTVHTDDGRCVGEFIVHEYPVDHVVIQFKPGTIAEKLMQHVASTGEKFSFTLPSSDVQLLDPSVVSPHPLVDSTESLSDVVPGATMNVVQKISRTRFTANDLGMLAAKKGEINARYGQ